jgi:RimJ/RimL family protein N-acetyltransferase
MKVVLRPVLNWQLMAASVRCNHPGGVLETARLILRPPQDTDLKALARLYAMPEVGHSLKLGVLTPQATAELLSDYLHMWFEHGFGTRMILDKTDMGFMGEVGLRLHDRTGEPAMRYALHPDFWGQGFAGEGVAATVDDAFGCIGLERVDAFSRDSNKGSLRILEKAGAQITETTEIPTGILYKYSFFRNDWLTRV